MTKLKLNEALALMLKKYRTDLGYSQEEFAYRCGLDRTYISLMERGKRNPTIKTIFIMSKNLNVKPSQFIKDIEELVSDLY
ncbi:helix-turn-helix domain-containing protein [Caldicellulosiruptoraceae bacterium PP1]